MLPARTEMGTDFFFISLGDARQGYSVTATSRTTRCTVQPKLRDHEVSYFKPNLNIFARSCELADGTPPRQKIGEAALHLAKNLALRVVEHCRNVG